MSIDEKQDPNLKCDARISEEALKRIQIDTATDVDKTLVRVLKN